MEHTIFPHEQQNTLFTLVITSHFIFMIIFVNHSLIFHQFLKESSYFQDCFHNLASEQQ